MNHKTIKLPKNSLELFDDEKQIDVYSALGSYCGSFMWLKKEIKLIKELNKKSKHYSFIIKNDNQSRKKRKT
jgi:hypothetical protein